MSKQFGTPRRLLQVPEEKGLTAEQVESQMLSTGFYSDLCEAAVLGNIVALNRDEHRKSLGLFSLTPPVMELVKVLDCPATEAFNLDDFFTTSNKVVKFGWIDSDLKRYFKTQLISAEGPRKLAVGKLTRNTKEKELLATAPKKTTWADLKWELEQQPNGESGNLLTNGWANLRFIGDCLVNVYLSDGGWSVDVSPVGGSSEWPDGHQLVSRN